MFMNSKILIVHGGKKVAADVYQPLKAYFPNIICTSEFEEIKNVSIDLIIVDYSVSDMAGILLYKKISQSANHCLIPAIFIADTKSYDHRLNAFEMGAADFVSRPLESNDLIKKCLSHIKNCRRIVAEKSIHIANLTLYADTESVVINNESITLTHLEHKILHFLLSMPHQIVSRSEVYKNVWGGTDFSKSGRLDTQLCNLKKKLVKFNGKIKSLNKVGIRILIAESTFSQEPKKSVPRSRPQGPHL